MDIQARSTFDAHFKIATLGEINLALQNLKSWMKLQTLNQVC
ncbi:hypothetical protein [Cyanobacterium sp. uoEpiScrs1]|nr:hypothetical protein [Cyanobacterium sp. uoEpiScrs1]